MSKRRILTAKEQYELLNPWRIAAPTALAPPRNEALPDDWQETMEAHPSLLPPKKPPSLFTPDQNVGSPQDVLSEWSERRSDPAAPPGPREPIAPWANKLEQSLYKEFMEDWWPNSSVSQERTPEKSLTGWSHFPNEPITHWLNVEDFLNERHPEAATGSHYGLEDANEILGIGQRREWDIPQNILDQNGYSGAGNVITQAMLNLHNKLQGRTWATENDKYRYYELMLKHVGPGAAKRLSRLIHAYRTATIDHAWHTFPVDPDPYVGKHRKEKEPGKLKKWLKSWSPEQIALDLAKTAGFDDDEGYDWDDGPYYAMAWDDEDDDDDDDIPLKRRTADISGNDNFSLVEFFQWCAGEHLRPNRAALEAYSQQNRISTEDFLNISNMLDDMGLDGHYLEMLRFAAQQEALGDCYEAAAHYLMDHALGMGVKEPNNNLRIVHGEVAMQGRHTGKTMGHAWIEDGDTVIDQSNGRDIRMPKNAYYQLGKINELNNFHVYAPEEARKRLIELQHYGPWDLSVNGEPAPGRVELEDDEDDEYEDDEDYYDDSEDVANWLGRTSGKNGDLPDLKFKYYGVHPFTGDNWFEAEHEGNTVGRLFWHHSESKHPSKGEIGLIQVHPEYRRRGIANKMVDIVRGGIDPGLQYSSVVTPNGKAWSKANGYKPSEGWNDIRPRNDKREWGKTAQRFWGMASPEDAYDQNPNDYQRAQIDAPLQQNTSGKWYHVSPHKMEPGAILSPGGGTSPYNYNNADMPTQRQQDWVWMDGPDAVKQWYYGTLMGQIQQGNENPWAHIYEVEPSEGPHPWNGSGQDGHVAPTAKIVREIATDKYNRLPDHLGATEAPKTWLHASPYELPVGTKLTPGGGKGGKELGMYAPGTGMEGHENHVWVAPAGWDMFQQYDPAIRPYVYEVAPEGEPEKVNDWGWRVPSATITKVHSSEGDTDGTMTNDDFLELNKGVIEWQKNHPPETQEQMIARMKQEWLDKFGTYPDGSKPVTAQRFWAMADTTKWHPLIKHEPYQTSTYGTINYSGIYHITVPDKASTTGRRVGDLSYTLGRKGDNHYVLDEDTGQYVRKPRANDEVTIDSLVVHPDHQGQGVAQALIERLHKDLPTHRINPGVTTPEGYGFTQRMMETNPGAQDLIEPTWTPNILDDEDTEDYTTNELKRLVNARLLAGQKLWQGAKTQLSLQN